MDTLNQQRLDREFRVTETALKETRILVDKEDKNYKKAEEFLDTATRYCADAKYFKNKNDRASAFGALNYAHGWLDAGKSIGLLR